MNTFEDFSLPEALSHTLQHMQFHQPTPIQAEAIPPALEGKDILGSAQTGTGKTAAFGIPLVAQLMSNPKGSALVMAPTRELATQVIKQLCAMLGKRSKIRSALLIGGEPIPKQMKQLRRAPRLIVGTPGRINDHLDRGSLTLKDAHFLVLDETDRMLDMGFSIQIEQILSHMPQERQTMLFSATLPKNIMHIAKKYLTDPVRIAVNATNSPAKNIKQDNLYVRESEKFGVLLDQLNEKEGSVLIFVKTKHGAERLAFNLAKEGHRTDTLHGDLRQTRRDRVTAAFRNEKFRILVATDIAARGLDIPHIEHVINHDLPQCAEDYIHRIGRTARAGAEGCALNLITPGDKQKWYAIEQLINPDAKPEKRKGKPSPSKKRPFNASKKRPTDKKRFYGKKKPNGQSQSQRPAAKKRHRPKKAA